MDEQLAFTLSAATVGFVAAVFFCIGNTLNTADKILLQATPYWDFSAPVARALASQRAQYVAGALLLLSSFVLQVFAVVASSTTPAAIPQSLHTWLSLVFVVLVTSFLFASGFAWFLYEKTIAKVLLLVEVQRKEDAQASSKSPCWKQG